MLLVRISKCHLIFLMISKALILFGQGQPTILNQKKQFENTFPTNVQSKTSLQSTTPNQNIVWQEDFANGVQSTWQNVNAGTGGAGLWDYRGTGSGATLSADTGSRGAYNGSRGPIQSASRSNGFVILDSDWLDNNGVTGAIGTGTAPSPHLAHLITETFNLSGETNVSLSFTQYYRCFAGPGGNQAVPATYVDFSIDGGATFPYSIIYNASIPVNNSTNDDDVVSSDVSVWLAGQSQVQIRFRFDGDYYFWMLDDIELSSSSVTPTTPYLDLSGCLVCDMLTAGAAFNLNGATYTVVDRPLFDTMRDNGSDLSKVCVSLVTDMSGMLDNKKLFNQDISSWDVSNVTNMKDMFELAEAFNQDIGNWDVSNVTSMGDMFGDARTFNQDIGGWDVSNVTNMVYMFEFASSFNQDLSGWCVTNIPIQPVSFSFGSPLSAAYHPIWGTCPN